MKPYLAKYVEKPETKMLEISGTGNTRTIEDTDPDEIMIGTIVTETVEDTDADEYKP